MTKEDRTLVAGIGSDFGDDRLGWVVVDKLAESTPHCVVKALRKPLDLLDHLAGIEVLHLVDACYGAASPGTIQSFDWPVNPPQDIRFGGTHDFDLLSALRLAESLGALPLRVTIWTISTVPPNGDPTGGVSAMVAKSIEALAERIRAEVAAPREAARPA